MEDDDQQFIVLMNDEEQYSLWPAGTVVPEGWQQTGPTGSREDCEAFVEATWTDMTPKSQRA